MNLPAVSLPRIETGRFSFGAGTSSIARFRTPRTWEAWLEAHFGRFVSRGFADHHREFWRHIWGIERDNDPAAFVGIWARGGAKSSSAELGVAALGLRKKRRYCLYVRDTQDRADDSVGTNISGLLEHAGVEKLVGKHGNSKGWRRNRVRTADGFTADALGLDVAARGVKLEDQRPDLIVFDDIDGRHDSARITKKKLETITDSILPAGTDNVAVIFIQNLIIPDGIAARLADGRADFLSRRVVSGPHPAMRDLKTEKQPHPDDPERLQDVIVSGSPVWQGQDRDACQRLIDRIGLSAFIRECQHQVKEREGALWSRDLLTATRTTQAPNLKRVIVGVDPSGGGDEIGIVGAGKGYDNHGYVLRDRSLSGSPNTWGRAAVDLFHELKADAIVAERNFGGDMVAHTLKTVDPNVPVIMVTASRGKAVRAEPIASLYEENRVHHIGTFPELETELVSWVPGDPDSPNRLDAAVWALTELMIDPHQKKRAGVWS